MGERGSVEVADGIIVGACDMSFVRLSAAAFIALWVAACAGTPETGQGPKENTAT